MNEEFYRRQAEANQEHDRHNQTKHATMETYGLEQQEAQSGHIPAPQTGAPPATPPSLWQRMKKMLGL